MGSYRKRRALSNTKSPGVIGYLIFLYISVFSCVIPTLDVVAVITHQKKTDMEAVDKPLDDKEDETCHEKVRKRILLSHNISQPGDRSDESIAGRIIAFEQQCTE